MQGRERERRGAPVGSPGVSVRESPAVGTEGEGLQGREVPTEPLGDEERQEDGGFGF